jgi:hypothetical protein
MKTKIEPQQVTRTSILSGVTRTMTISCDIEDLKRHDSGGVLIQEALPYLTDDEREFIMTGITREEWADHFKQK